MRYHTYRQKIQKLLGFIQGVFAHIKLILTVTAIVTAFIVAASIVIGMVYGEENIQDTCIYGDSCPYVAKAVWSPIEYEFGMKDENGTWVWQKEEPIYPGDYAVRTVTTGFLGVTRHLKMYVYRIIPKEVDVFVYNDTVEWGNDPAVKMTDPAYEDTLLNYSLEWEDYTSEKTDITVKQASIVIADKKGMDVTNCYQVNTPSIQVTVKPLVLTVTVHDASFVYNGMPYTFDGYEISSGAVLSDEQLVAVFNEKRTDVGESDNTPALRVIRASGEDVTVHYVMTTISGKLSVTKRPLTISTESNTRVYDTTERVYNGITVDENTPTAEGHTVIGEFLALTNVTKQENIPPVIRILDADKQDVTANYSVFINAGTLEITPKEVTITTPTKEWVYDAIAHSCEDTEMNGLLPGHYVQIGAIPSLCEAGTLINSREIIIEDESGTDVTSNYAVTELFGILTVTCRPLGLTTKSNSWTYDGLIHSEPDLIVEDNLAEGHTVQCNDFVCIQNVGEVLNARDIVILNEDGQDVTYNYDLNPSFGMLKVSHRPITVKTESGRYVYDGSLISLPDTAVTNVAEGHYVENGNYPTAQNVGIVENSRQIIIYDNLGAEVTENYGITEQFGVIEIIPRPLTVITESGKWEYDGSAHQVKQHTIQSSSLAKGQTLQWITVPEIIHVGTVSNMPDLIVTDRDGNDVTFNYQLTVDSGTLTVVPRSVSIRTESGTWMYDGYNHQQPLYQYQSSTHLADTDTLKAEYTVVNDVCTQEPNFFVGDVHIVNQKGENVDHDYVLTVNYGELNILPRPITVTTPFADKTYDGLPLVSNIYKITSPIQLADGHSVSVGDYLNPINAGIYENKPSSFVINAKRNGKTVDVTANYTITFQYGMLSIYKRPIVLAADDAKKIYDDTPLTTNCCVSPMSVYTIVTGETLFATVPEKRTNVGETVCHVEASSVSVTKSDGSDSTQNYELTYISGTLTVLPRNITVESASAQKKYDGKPLTAPEIFIATSSLYTLVEGHSLKGIANGSRTEIGISANTIKNNSVKIINSMGNDVTSNYCMDACIEGKLEVLPIAAIEVRTVSDKKIYDGLPLTNHHYGMTIDREVPEGVTVDVHVTGTITEPGKVDNTAEVTVRDRQGNDVSQYYQITVIPGTLVTYLHSDETSKQVGTVQADMVGRLYLRQHSYGIYLGNGWAESPIYDKLLPNSMNANGLTALSLQKNGILALHTAQFTDMTYFMLPYYTKTTNGTAPIQTDTVYINNECNYTAQFLYTNNIDWMQLDASLEEYTDYEYEYGLFVRQNYLDVDEATASYLKQEFIEKYRLDASSDDIIERVAELIQGSAKYNLKYNPALDYSTSMVTDFLSVYKEGVCRHYAAAATLLFRTLGIPARYVEGFTVVIKRANEPTPIMTPGHAWTEIYLDKVGWVPVEVTGSDGSQNSEMPSQQTIIQIELTPKFQSKVYDGTPLYAVNELDHTEDLDKLIAEGYTYKVDIGGQITDIGKGISTIVNFTLYDHTGRDVTYEVPYHFIFKEGVLCVTGETIRIFPYELAKYYDGQPLLFTEDDYAILTSIDNMEFVLKTTIQWTRSCVYTISYLNTHFDEFFTYQVYVNGIDVTLLYTVLFDVPNGFNEDTYYPIRISPCSIEFTSESVSKEFDYGVLTAPNVFISKGELANGETFEAEAIGQLNEIGSIENYINQSMLIIYDKNHDDITACYDILLKFGQLTYVENE